MKLFLLDAYALIYRSYYAFIKNPRINSKGQNTSAILGFVNTLEDVLKKEDPSHIGIAFDPSGPTFRHEAYEAYKAKREETPEVIRESVPIIKEIIEAYRIPILEVPGFEADDVIGTLAKKGVNEGFEVYMMTPDKDYAQLVAEKIFIYKPKHGSSDFEILGIDEVKEKYELHRPEQMIDLLSLMGDKSDNIPGCPGIGEVIAKRLIADYGSLEQIFAHVSDMKGSMKDRLETNREIIEFSRFLATIRTDVPIELDVNALKRGKANEEKLRTLFQQLEFRNLSARVFGKESRAGEISAKNVLHGQGSLFPEFDPEPTATELFASSFSDLNSTPHNYKLLLLESEIYDLIAKIYARRVVTFDTETTGIDPLTSELVGMSFAIEENQAFYLPVPDKPEDAKRLLKQFKPLFESDKILKIGQNMKYDMLVLKKYDIEINGPLFDTMIAHYLLNPELRHNMDYLAETYLNYRTIHIEELIGAKGKNQLNMRQVPTSLILDYACEDADVTLKLKNIFEKKISENNLAQLF